MTDNILTIELRFTANEPRQGAVTSIQAHLAHWDAVDAAEAAALNTGVQISSVAHGIRQDENAPGGPKEQP